MNRATRLLLLLGVILPADCLAELNTPIRTYVSRFDPEWGECECADETDYREFLADPTQPESLRVVADSLQRTRPCTHDNSPVEVEQMAQQGTWRTVFRTISIPRGELVLSGWDLPPGFWLVRQRTREGQGLWSCWNAPASHISIQLGGGL